MERQPSASEVEMPNVQANGDIPEESDSVNFSDDDASHPYAPPPRIAARFYRPSNSRRRSSAASSRRNSISSTQSHQSNRSLRSGSCQSNHVAQHLRRASIIESRKARLAAREAHAEQVRLRAALAKAAPRASNSEERALAAQQAREKHLAQVAAACAEEVRRAKKVAEDMKERKAAEERRYRLGMEEKLAEAEKRRLEYKRNTRRPRTTSVPAADAKRPIDESVEDMAAQRIQAVWRSRRRRRIVEIFFDLGLSVDRVRETSFEEMGRVLSDTRVLSTTEKVLEIFNLRNMEETESANKTGTRTFLSAYLILGHPAEVLSKDGDQEQDLIDKAKDLLISFESTLSKLTAWNRYTPTSTQLEILSLAHSAYLAAFSAWKAQDSSAFIETMVATFVNLDAIWQSVKDDTEGEVAADYHEGIRENQVVLLSKIRKLAGPDRANLLIKKAIRESRRAKARRRPVGDVRPRAAVEDTIVSPSGTEESNSVAVEVAARLPQDVRQTENLQFHPLTKLFSPIPDNRIVAHELAIDKEFRIDISPHSNLRDTVNREVCESMRRGFEQGEGSSWTVAMAENIRSRLLGLLRKGSPMHSLISETLDPTLIRNQCTQGIFSYKQFFSFMASILPKLCAPFRDAQVKTLADSLREEGDLNSMIDKLFELLHVIDLLSLDYQNFLIAQVSPMLIKESVGYEQRMFAQDLEAGAITLQKTKRWWRNASVNVLTEADQRDPLHRPTTHRMYARGLVDLAIATTPLLHADVPETLEMDKARLSRIRADAVRIVTVGAILLTAKNLLKRDVRSQWKAEASRMWDTLKDGYTNEDDSMPMKFLSIMEFSHAMPPVTKISLTSTISRLLGQASAGRLTDPVMKVLFQRLKAHVFNRLSASSSGERVRAVSMASEGLATSGLPEFVSHVGEIVDTLTKMSEVDRKVHGTWYEEIAKEVEGAGGEE